MILSDTISWSNADGWDVWSVFRTQHFDLGKNLGGNLLRGDGSVEWYPWDANHWVVAGNGHYNVSPWGYQ